MTLWISRTGFWTGVLALAVFAGGCNTLRGVGRDISVIGGTVEGAGDKTSELASEAVDMGLNGRQRVYAAPRETQVQPQVQPWQQQHQQPQPMYQQQPWQEQQQLHLRHEQQLYGEPIRDRHYTEFLDGEQKAQRQPMHFERTQRLYQHEGQFDARAIGNGHRIGEQRQEFRRTTETLRLGGGQLERANKLLGSEVLDARGDNIGQLEQLIVDLDAGKVTHAVVSLYGPRDTYYMIPWQLVDSSARGRQLHLQIERQALRQGPSFQRWQALDDPRLYRAVSSFYRTPEHREGMAFGRLIGTEVHGRTGQRLGVIEDALVDLSTGNLQYVMLSLRGPNGEVWGQPRQPQDRPQQQRQQEQRQLEQDRVGQQPIDGERLAIVPWHEMNLRQRTVASAFVPVERQQLDEIAFQAGREPRFDERYTRRIEQRFEARPGVYGIPRDRLEEGQERQLQGTIESIGAFSHEFGEGQRLRLLTDDGQTINVNAPSRELLNQENIRLQHGDRVQLTGRMIERDGQEVLHVTEIRKVEVFRLDESLHDQQQQQQQQQD